jgi:sugar O-acyltransferase (sialic acid O-acetyltransferase NeuD family)
MTTSLLIIGAGGFARAVMDALRHLPSLRPVGLLDDRHPELNSLGGLPVLGRISQLVEHRNYAQAAVIAIGNPMARAALFEQAQAAGFALPAVIHPRAYVAEDVDIGAGAIVMAGAIVCAATRLGDGCLVNAGAIIDHDCCIGRFSHIGIAASMGGGATLTDGSWLKQGHVLAAMRQLCGTST